MEKENTLPTRFVYLNESFTRYGVRLTCVLRPRGLNPRDACLGCWFNKARRGATITTCRDIQCSSWDRMDGKNVWFVESHE